MRKNGGQEWNGIELWYTRLSELKILISWVKLHLFNQIIVMRLNTLYECMDSIHFDKEECLKTHIARVWKDLCIQFMVMHVSLIWVIVMQKIVRTRCTSLKDSLVRFIVILEIVWIHFTSAGTFIDWIYCDTEDCVNPFHESRKLHWFGSLCFWRLFGFILA